MKFDTGRFLIKNADSGNLAVLPDANQGTDLAGAIPGLDDNLKGEKWNIVLLSSKKFNKYKIQNFDFASYASCDTRPDPGHSVRGKTGARQWTIKEMNRPGHYIISTGNDPELFWGLPDDEDGTPVELSDKGSDPHNQWTFERVSDLDDSIRDLAGDSRSQRLKALNDFPSLAAAQLDVAIQAGGLGSVIKLLSDSDTIIQSTASTALTTLALTVFPQTIVDLYGWKSVTSQIRALQRIVDFALVDQIKAAAVESYLIPHLVKLLESEETTVVDKSLEALKILMSIPAARTAAHEAQAGPILQQLAASDSSFKGTAEAAFALVGPSDAARSPAATLYSPEVLAVAHPSRTPSVKFPEVAKRQPKRSNTLPPPLEPEALPSAPMEDDRSTDITGGGTAFVDRSDLNSPALRSDSVTTPGSGLSEPRKTTVPTDASVQNLVAFLQANDSAAWGAAARGLRNATQDDAKAQNLALALETIPALVKILATDLSDTIAIGYIIETLANIVAFNDEAKVSAVEGGVLPHLIQLLYNSTVCGKAALAIRILSRNALAQVASEAAGAVPALVRLLEEREEAVTRINAAGALTNISKNEAVQKVVWEAGPLLGLVHMLNSPDRALHPSSTGALWSLSTHVKARADISIHISRFAELLSSDQLIVRTNAAGVLSNVCAENDLKESAMNANVIPPLVQLIQSTEDLTTLKNGVSSLSGLATLPIAQTTLTSSGCLPTLVKFLHSDDMTLRSDSVATIWYISRCKEGKKGIADAGGIPPLVKLLSDKDKDIQQRAASALWNINTLDIAIRKESLAAGCLTPLIKLVNSGHIPSRKPAAATLWNLFIVEEATRIGIELNSIPALLKLMLNAEMDWLTRTKAAGALNSLAVSQDGKIVVAAVGGIKGLISCLKPVHSLPKEVKGGEEEAQEEILPEEEKATQQETETARNNFIYQVCSALWNVCIPPANQSQALSLGAIPKLIPLLRHSSPKLCGKAAGALGNIASTWGAKAASRDAIPALVELLKLDNEHIDVKEQAARCLANITEDYAAKRSAVSAIPWLTKLLQSNNPAATIQAASALQNIIADDDDARAVARAHGVTELLKRLVSQYANDTNAELVVSLKSALKKMSKYNLGEVDDLSTFRNWSLSKFGVR